MGAQQSGGPLVVYEVQFVTEGEGPECRVRAPTALQGLTLGAWDSRAAWTEVELFGPPDSVWGRPLTQAAEGLSRTP